MGRRRLGYRLWSMKVYVVQKTIFVDKCWVSLMRHLLCAIYLGYGAMYTFP